MDVWYALGIPRPYGLFQPEHMSQIRPAVRVRGRLCLTELPANRLLERGSEQITGHGKLAYPILLQKAL
jgi:hypothetical protein